MSIPWVTGPCCLWASLNNAKTTPIFIGNFKVTARIVLENSFSPVMSDRAGGVKPHDWIYDGMDGGSFGDLTVWNWTPLLGIMSAPDAITAPPGQLPITFGSDPWGSRGSLMITEGKAYTVWYVFPYAIKAPYGGFMIPGLRFPYSFLIGPAEFDMGTKENRIPIAFKHAAGEQADGSWLCCDTNMTGTTLVPPSLTS